MELGYVTKQGFFGSVDSYRRRIIFRAYRFDNERSTLDFLGVPRPLEKAGNVVVSLTLHRKGWGSPGESVLRPTHGQLMRTKTSHFILGGPGSWKSLKKFRRTSAAGVFNQSFASSAVKPRPWQEYPTRKSPFILAFQDPSVKACRLRGRIVELFATELKENTDFSIGKLTATVEFSSERESTAFAQLFPKVVDLEGLDKSVTVDVNRERNIVWNRGAKVSAIAFVTLNALLVVPWLIIGASSGSLTRFFPLGAFAGMLELLFVAVLFIDLERFRTERLELVNKWPRLFLERWAQEFKGHASAFAFAIRELGIPLSPETGEINPLDDFLRKQPANTFFGSFAWGAAALTAAVLLDSLRRPIPFEWKYHSAQGTMMLNFPSLQMYVSPFHRVRETWERKGGPTLDEYVRETTESILTTAAFQPVPEFLALGFLKSGWNELDALTERVRSDMKSVSPRSIAIGESHFLGRSAAYGDFEIFYLEAETISHRGPIRLPFLAVPFCLKTQSIRARLEGSAMAIDRQDTALLRFDSYPLVPVAVQLRNYAEIGPAYANRKGLLTLDLLAVADQVHVISPRMRALRSETKDFIAPKDPSPEGQPTGPYASVVGRITSVGELLNPVSGIPLWRLGLDIAGFSFHAIVRKDRCDVLPEVDNYVAGDVWLVANLVGATETLEGYIR